MKKTFFAATFLMLVLFAGAGCAKESEVMNGDRMMKPDTTSSVMDDQEMMHDDEGAMMKDDGAMKKEGDAMMKDDSAMMKKDDGTVMVKKEVPVVAKGSYQTYSPEKLALAKEGKVVIFFKASWCPTCRAVDADINAHLSEIPSGVAILIADYDTTAELKKKYGVTYQHTFVQVDANGTMLKKWSGSPTLAALVKEVK